MLGASICRLHNCAQSLYLHKVWPFHFKVPSRSIGPSDAEPYAVLVNASQASQAIACPGVSFSNRFAPSAPWYTEAGQWHLLELVEKSLHCYPVVGVVPQALFDQILQWDAVLFLHVSDFQSDSALCFVVEILLLVVCDQSHHCSDSHANLVNVNGRQSLVIVRKTCIPIPG